MKKKPKYCARMYCPGEEEGRGEYMFKVMALPFHLKGKVCHKCGKAVALHRMITEEVKDRPMKRIGAALLVVVLGAWSCGAAVSQRVVERVSLHSAAIAVYYYMTPEEQARRVAERAKEGVGRWQVVIPLNSRFQGQEVKAVAYLGAGTLLREGHVLTVRHLFVHDQNTLGSAIYVMFPGVDHPIGATVVAISSGEPLWNDYAVIKLAEIPEGRDGLIVAERGPKWGDELIATGSPGGMAFFRRFVRATSFHQFFSKDALGGLHLARWTDFPYLCVYPGGPGDSGGGIVNGKGEVVGVMYCGIEVYAENYVFSNPTSTLWDFLKMMGLGWIAK